jgi:hypothetical protein
VPYASKTRSRHVRDPAASGCKSCDTSSYIDFFLSKRRVPFQHSSSAGPARYTADVGLFNCDFHELVRHVITERQAPTLRLGTVYSDLSPLASAKEEEGKKGAICAHPGDIARSIYYDSSLDVVPLRHLNGLPSQISTAPPSWASCLFEQNAGPLSHSGGMCIPRCLSGAAHS